MTRFQNHRQGIIVARKPKVQVHRYKCTITDEEFKTTAKAENPEELISVAAYYEMNPDKDDRPEHIKQELGITDSE